jgi:hypothetical protein
MDKQKVEEALGKLGATRDDVANTLREQECIGTRGWVQACPVARYLQKTTGYLSMAVAPERVYIGGNSVYQTHD